MCCNPFFQKRMKKKTIKNKPTNKNKNRKRKKIKKNEEREREMYLAFSLLTPEKLKALRLDCCILGTTGLLKTPVHQSSILSC